MDVKFVYGVVEELYRHLLGARQFMKAQIYSDYHDQGFCFFGKHGFPTFWTTNPRGLSPHLNIPEPSKSLPFGEVGV